MNGRRSVTLKVSQTEEYTTVFKVTTRVKSQDLLLRYLLYLEYWESLPEEIKHLKYYFPKFYTSKEFILLQDLILITKNSPRRKYNKRLQFLWQFGLLPGPVTKQDCVSTLAGLEVKLQKFPTKGHNTSYGYVTHYRDHGHLPPAKPDYSMDPEELENVIMDQLSKLEKEHRIREFLLSKGRTNFGELFPAFREVIFQQNEKS